MPNASSHFHEVACAICCFILGGLAGCQSYKSEPLDLAGHRQAYLERAAEGQPVQEFARQLASVETPASVFNAGDGLTLAEAEVVALFYNPDLRVARLRAGVALATAKTAGLWEDPTLGIDAERILSGAVNPWVISGTLGITLPISGRLEAEKIRAGAASEAELRRVAAQEWTVRADLRRAWMQWSQTMTRVTLQRELLTRLDELVRLVERLEKAGEYTRVDARVFRIEKLTQITELESLEGKAAQAELHVRSLMGLSSTASVQLIAGTSYTTLGASTQDRRAALEKRNPELAALRAEYEVAQATVRREVRGQYPDLTIGPGGGSDEGDSRAIVGLSLPLPLWNRNQQGVAEALAQRDLARSQFQVGYERMAIALDTAAIQHRSAASQRKKIETEIVPLVDEQESDTRKLAAAGRLDPLLILDAITRQQDAKQRLLEASVAESLALIRLDELTGPREPQARTP